MVILTMPIVSSEVCFLSLNSWLLLVFQSHSACGGRDSAVSCPTADIWITPALLGKRFFSGEANPIPLHRPSKLCSKHLPKSFCCDCSFNGVLLFIRVWAVRVYLEIPVPPSWPGRNCLCRRCCLSPQKFLLPCPLPAPQLQRVQYQRKRCR